MPGDTRSERAIRETSEKYGRYCYAIAYHILSNREDSEESVNDTYLAAWNNIPSRRPTVLSVFLGKITCYISLERYFCAGTGIWILCRRLRNGLASVRAR